MIVSASINEMSGIAYRSELHDNFDSVLAIVFPSSQSTLPSEASIVLLSAFGSMLTVFTLSIIVTILAVTAWRLKQRKKRIEGIDRLYYMIDIMI